MEFKPENCFNCGTPLTKKELKKFWNGRRCCDGYFCDCKAYPIDPPYCFKCLGKE